MLTSRAAGTPAAVTARVSRQFGGISRCGRGDVRPCVFGRTYLPAECRLPATGLPSAYVTFWIDGRFRMILTVTNARDRKIAPALTAQFINTIGLIGAALTTLCWIPQAVKVIRDKETRAISLVSTLGLTIGGVFWLVYGIGRLDWPLVFSSGISLALTLVILRFKLSYG